MGGIVNHQLNAATPDRDDRRRFISGPEARMIRHHPSPFPREDDSKEVAWWHELNINAREIAKGLWDQTHPKPRPTEAAEIPRSDAAAAKTTTES